MTESKLVVTVRTQAAVRAVKKAVGKVQRAMARAAAAERERCAAYCEAEGLHQTARAIRAGEHATMRPADLGDCEVKVDAGRLHQLVAAATFAQCSIAYALRYVNPEEVGTHLDMARLDRDLRAALALFKDRT